MKNRAPATDQLDLLALLAEIDPPPIPPKPASIYTFRARTLSEYRARYEQWRREDPENGFGMAFIAHAWTAYPFVASIPGQCDVVVINADLRCNHIKSRDGQCECVGSLVYRSICEHCGFHSEVYANEAAAVVDGLDHAYPGWRDSPIVPPCRAGADKKATSRWEATVREAYGERRRGWPIITGRDGPGTRSVEGRSPWKGYDVSDATLEQYPARPTVAITDLLREVLHHLADDPTVANPIALMLAGWRRGLDGPMLPRAKGTHSDGQLRWRIEDELLHVDYHRFEMIGRTFKANPEPWQTFRFNLDDLARWANTVPADIRQRAISIADAHGADLTAEATTALVDLMEEATRATPRGVVPNEGSRI